MSWPRCYKGVGAHHHDAVAESNVSRFLKQTFFNGGDDHELGYNRIQDISCSDQFEIVLCPHLKENMSKTLGCSTIHQMNIYKHIGPCTSPQAL